jgi:ABC-type bacteriocin/lantibiotic exporter with double-glycine peptidase domain
MKKWLLKTLSQYWRTMTVLILIQVAAGLLVSLQPRYYQRIVSLAIGDTESTLLAEGLPLVGLLAAIYLAGTALRGLTGYVGCTLSSDLLRHLQTGFFNKTSQLPLRFLQSEAAGEFFTRFNNDIGQVQRFVADIVPSAVRECITALAATAILFYFCPPLLTSLALVIVVITSLLVIHLNRIMAGYAKAQRRGWSQINRWFDETIQGMDTLKTFATEKQRGEYFHKVTQAFRDLSVRAGSVAAVFSPGIDLVSKLGGLLLVFIAYYMISKGNIEVEPFLLFFFYAALLQASISSLVGSMSNIQPHLVAIQHISSFFCEPTEEDDGGGASPPKRMTEAGRPYRSTDRFPSRSAI